MCPSGGPCKSHIFGKLGDFASVAQLWTVKTAESTLFIFYNPGLLDNAHNQH